MIVILLIILDHSNKDSYINSKDDKGNKCKEIIPEIVNVYTLKYSPA